MIEWGLEKPRLEKPMLWFLSPPPQFIDSNNNSPLNSFMDYIYPVVDRLSPTFNGYSLLGYYNFHFNRASRINISLLTQNRMPKAFSREYQLLSCLGKGGSKRVPYEVEILWRLRGISGIICIFEHFEEPDRFIFTMEKIANSCTLFHFVMENSSLNSTELLRHLFQEIIRINITLQNYGVWHRDWKPENIIYCKTDRSLRFIDFGSAVPVQ
ncbi:unnamed protein product [Rotaria magnacalcarata]|uniref:non-specific serine/threonine protein kinase n=1 Tax=Rotaria magnacalcarata TaxID=392030 RepID=A0A8S2L6Q9_9BILA|nr:unnamed protein product [Rotaria magnacalcarata]CAF4522402.1 unnamed protein product [Rotaria magnacalcarata]